MKAVIDGALHGFDRGITTILTRAAERLTAYGRWAGPATKTNGHVSGDALKPYIDALGEYPLPNIWRTNDRR